MGPLIVVSSCVDECQCKLSRSGDATDCVTVYGSRGEELRVLLVEDDAMIGESVRKGLRQDGFTVDWTRDGAAAEAALAGHAYDAILLDLGLPRKSGVEVLKSLRRGGSDVPVLITTARDAVSD